MDVEQFISSVFVKNPLWDQKDPQHHNRHILDKLWDAVAKEMISTRTIVRKKWKSLRDTFRKEIRKTAVIKHSGDGYVAPIKSTWQYFDSLNFLRDQFTARSSGGNLPDEGGNQILDNEDTQNINTQDNDFVNNDEEINTRTSTPTSSTSRFGKGKKRNRQNVQEEVGETLVKLEESKLRLLDNQSNKETDEDMSFFESLLPHIRTLTPQRKLLLRMNIQQTVYNFIYEQEKTATQNIQNSAPTSQQTDMHRQQYNLTAIGQTMTTHHEFSNPSSVASYLSNYSEDAS